uniref:Transglutaminase-like domain-containing protein n=1 Tax=Amphimedon queenslandica TaxID=400682 RepID=A0A1X7TBY3_AMPQE
MSLEDKCWTAFDKRDHKEAVRLLPLVKEPNKIRRTFNRYSLLHLSSRNGWLDVTKDLITKYHCDPHERDGADCTCLHWAARGNHVDVMRYLIDECHCDPMAIDLSGRTPLYLAAYWGNSAAAEYLLSTGKCDPLAKDKYGDTPFTLAKEKGHTDTLSVLKKFGGIQSSHPIDSYVNVLLVGNPGAGKSTLSHVISDTASFTLLGSFRNVGGVVPCTAGIIPYKLQHRTLGNIILHDFAGHSEYYSSHSAVIENLLQGSGGVFLIVVNILEKEAVKQLHQWLTVVRNEAQKALNQCHVIVIVSHVDEISNPVERRRRKEEIQEIIVKERCDSVFLDCRKLGGSGVDSFFNKLCSACESIRSTSGRNLSLYCHMMYGLLEERKENILTLSDVVSSTNGEVRYRVHTPPDVPVGSYRCHVHVPLGKNKSKGERVWEDKKEVVFLFNPWNKDDSVYLPNERERNEYINNETGLIWAGTHDSTFTWPWNFAQFEVISLETVLYMLDSWRLGSDARRSPIHVTRCLANMVNNNDGDNGALIGLWSSNDDDYADGTSPTSWSGSEAILTQYMSEKKPVRYAQCWVFGGTLTTVLRTIGIPSRPVTNFESAHDADFNRAIDYYFDRNDKMIEDKSNDSIWNYHVWVEAWMTRPDLDGDYGGWQAVDATPQELSPHSRTMVVGPASIQAVKDGKDLKYDNEFVIAEVNADIKYHVEKSDGSFAVVSRHETKVGKHISTKAVGRNSREDVTSHYKYPEGSASERAALMGGRGHEEEEKGAVSFSAKLTSGRRIGEDLTFGVTAKINSPIS